MKELTLEITNRCRLSCMQCSTSANRTGHVFVTLDDINRYLDRFDDYTRVRLSGGEPFAHPQLLEIVQSIKSRGREVYILSSGVLESGAISEGLAARLKPFVDEVVLSVHGDWNTHDCIVSGDQCILSHPPYWDCVMDSLDQLRWNGVPTSIQTVAMQVNYDKLESIAEYVGHMSQREKRLKRWHVLRFISQGRGAAHPDQVLTPAQVRDLPHLLKKWETEINASRFPDVEHGAYVQFTCTASFYPHNQVFCNCGNGKAVVTYDQRVIPCSALKDSPIPYQGGRKFPCLNYTS